MAFTLISQLIQKTKMKKGTTALRTKKVHLVIDGPIKFIQLI
jgi:hypothetical protein